ncbi:MAG: hypothetical protein QGH20_04695 [Candidatus Latescibacteria bacterium]|nr:hypothetical protein [Candidatus Latescibacterota bacterium]
MAAGSMEYHRESIPRGAAPESGAEITQLSSSAYIHTHIYPETQVWTPDSTRFVYRRFQSLDAPHSY